MDIALHLSRESFIANECPVIALLLSVLVRATVVEIFAAALLPMPLTRDAIAARSASGRIEKLETLLGPSLSPFPDPTPSEADVKVTRDLIRAGQLMKIKVIDHVVLGRGTTERPKDYMSLRELGYFYS